MEDRAKLHQALKQCGKFAGKQPKIQQQMTRTQTYLQFTLPSLVKQTPPSIIRLVRLLSCSVGNADTSNHQQPRAPIPSTRQALGVILPTNCPQSSWTCTLL